MKQFFLYALLALISTSLYAQVGIGTTTPKAFLNVATGKDVLFGNDVSGKGSKLMWIPSQNAFRAGFVNDTYWDLAQIGSLSFATGYNTLASGYNSIAMGFTAQASGNHSVAIGRDNQASGDYSISVGHQTQASGDYSTAMGTFVATDNKQGSFIIGDAAIFIPAYSNTATNQMMMRFSGGYTLYSTAPNNQSTAIGVRVAPGGNAWSVISDSTRKENFQPADGASFLHKISLMRLGSWNYKGQDVTQYRHYGPMAQDFFAAFGHDDLGTVGEDKSINQADFDGVNLIAIQALIKENQQLKAKLTAFEEKERVIQARLAKIETMLLSSSALATGNLKP